MLVSSRPAVVGSQLTTLWIRSSISHPWYRKAQRPAAVSERLHDCYFWCDRGAASRKAKRL